MITIDDFMTRILFLHDFPFGQLQEHRDEDGKLHHDSEIQARTGVVGTTRLLLF